MQRIVLRDDRTTNELDLVTPFEEQFLELGTLI